MNITTNKKQETGEIWRLDPNGPGPRWVFPERPEDTVNQYVDFLHRFDCDGSASHARLRISADTDFFVRLNGKDVGGGQYSDYPDAKTFECFDVTEFVRTGRNELAVTVFYNGRTSSVYRRGHPGLLFEVRAAGRGLAASGTNTLCRTNPCYHSGPIAIVSRQLAYTFGYDARGKEEGEAEANWRLIADAEATVPDSRAELHPRPVSRLVDGGCASARLVQAGRFCYEPDAPAAPDTGDKSAREAAAGRPGPDGSLVSPAQLMMNAVLTPDGTGADTSRAGYDGIYRVFDLGREEVGHLELDIEAPIGTVLDIGYGEHLDDGRVRTAVGRRNFAARVVCGGKRLRFIHPFLRWAGRYLQIHVHADTCTLRKLTLRRSEYPVEQRGHIDTGNPRHTRLHDVGCHTLRLCMHEHYEDTPWREQALYANDARTQALCGYYAFGETDMPASSFSLLGRGLREDGFLNLTAPAKPPVTIPSFTFAWMLAVRDHLLYTGDERLARAFLPQLRSMLTAFLEERKHGVLPLRRQQGVWHFYDWSAGMSGYADEEFARGLEVDAPLNGFLILALEAYGQMLEWLGEPRDEAFATAVVELREAVAERFWDAQEGVFRTYQGADILTELTQALAILAGVGDEAMRTEALARMGRADSGLAKPGLSQSLYTFEALLTRGEQFGAKALDDIENTWGRMLDSGATTFWETLKGARDFGGAGSLCHGWSAVPVYILHHDVLGVRPLEPGFRTFAADPMTDVVPAANGRVPTPHGEISVEWERGPDGEVRCEVDAPSALGGGEGKSRGASTPTELESRGASAPTELESRGASTPTELESRGASAPPELGGGDG